MTRRITWPACACLALLMTMSGCRLIIGLAEPDEEDIANPDGGVDQPDAAPGAPDARPIDPPDGGADCSDFSPTPTYFDPCAAPAPSGGLNLSGGTWTFDTNTGALTDPGQNATFPASVLIPQTGGPEIRVLSVDALTVQSDATLVLSGKRPLAVMSWSNVVVNGTIDVASSSQRVGAGGDPDDCPTDLPSAGQDDVEGAGGGGGAGFGGAGGDGGTGNDAKAAAGLAGPAVSLPGVLRGACAGASGGGTSGGGGGSGGGALHITARNAIDIAGTLHAGGQGGLPSLGERSGGGGGGAGGLLSLQAPTLTITASAVLAANGGGGGGGSDNNPAEVGIDATADDIPAPGGRREGMGGDGADGGAGAIAAASGGDPRRGGGGGGGGVGFIVLRGATQNVDTGATLSPAPTIP